ncbi:MAG: cyanophycin synthetase [Chloroflexota bacterium]
MTRAARTSHGLAAARAARPIPAGQRIHVMGAAGAGASAAAWLAARAGASVTGCDPGAPSPYTTALEALGVPVATTHAASHVADGPRRLVDRLAVTKALTSVDPDHVELRAAVDAGIQPEAWQQVVADCAASQGGRLVGVAGTHGKSTSSGWLVHLLTSSGADPGAFVGALLPAALTGGPPGTARWGRGDAFVVEADEYAGNFDAYRPAVSVLLNAEWDHPDVFADEAAVLDAFEAWLRAPGAGSRTLVANAGDPGVARLLGRLGDWPGTVVRVALDSDTAGAHGQVDLAGHADREGMLRIEASDGRWGLVRPVTTRLALAGAHNAANALCVAGAAVVLGVPLDQAMRHLGTFQGVGRRLEVKGEPRGVLVLDDYGHHPTAIAVTMAAVRERHPGRRLWAVYEPLTYHRTAAMLEAFADVLATADRAVIADIWAGRDPDTTITSAAALATAVSARGSAPAVAAGSVEATADLLAAEVEPGDVVLVMGGGRSYVIAERLVEALGALPGTLPPVR